jgi:hypothetical protein
MTKLPSEILQSTHELSSVIFVPIATSQYSRSVSSGSIPQPSEPAGVAKQNPLPFPPLRLRLRRRRTRPERAALTLGGRRRRRWCTTRCWWARSWTASPTCSPAAAATTPTSPTTSRSVSPPPHTPPLA